MQITDIYVRDISFITEENTYVATVNVDLSDSSLAESYRDMGHSIVLTVRLGGTGDEQFNAVEDSIRSTAKRTLRLAADAV